MIHFSFKSARVHTTVSDTRLNLRAGGQPNLLGLIDIHSYGNVRVFDDLCFVMQVKRSSATRYLLTRKSSEYDVHSLGLTPAECRVLDDFHSFVGSVARLFSRVTLGKGVKSPTLSFSYMNCNTGKALVWAHSVDVGSLTPCIGVIS